VTTQSVAAVLRDVADRHRLWRHPFLARCKAGAVSAPEIHVLACQMYKFSREFNHLLARILVRCADEGARVAIAENLYEELGEGDERATHPELFRRFTRAIGIPDEILERVPAEPETAHLVDTYLGMPERRGYLAALGAVCFASEGIVSMLYAQLRDGILGARALPTEALVFFDLHISCDQGHAARLAEVVETRIRTPEHMRAATAAVTEALDARWGFFTAVERRARRPDLPELAEPARAGVASDVEIL
jgi:pyrroloquinoline-quinone synthase